MGDDARRSGREPLLGSQTRGSERTGNEPALGGASLIPHLEGLLGAEDTLVRKQAIRRLGTIRHPDAVKTLLLALNDPDSTVRRRAIERLGERG